MAKRVFSQTFGVVGAIIEKDGKFLLVKEAKAAKMDKGKWNQPAGWIEVGESPIDAVKHEVKEETGFDFTPTHVLGIYSLVRKDIASERCCYTPHAIKIIFLGEIKESNQEHIKEEITEIRWFTPEEIEKMDLKTLRDLDIKKEVKDYLAGKKYPLDIITHTISE